MNLLAIGGGDKQPAIKQALLRVDNPNVLIIPSASSTEASYDRKVTACLDFFHGFGLPEVMVLHKFGSQASPNQADDYFSRSSLAYIIGGNTPYLMKTITEHGTDKRLLDFSKNNRTIAGTSAGALILFESGQTLPVARPTESEWSYETIQGLGIIPASGAVHADKKDFTSKGQNAKSRLEYFINQSEFAHNTGIAIEEGAALSIFDDEPGVILADPSKHIYLIEKSSYGTKVTEATTSSDLGKIINQC